MMPNSQWQSPLMCGHHVNFLCPPTHHLLPLKKTSLCLFYMHRECSTLMPFVIYKQFNSSPPSAEYMHWRTGSKLVQIMTCRLDGAKPLSEPMLIYCQLDPREHISMKFYLKFIYFHSRKCVWTCRLRNDCHIVQGKTVYRMTSYTRLQFIA